MDPPTSPLPLGEGQGEDVTPRRRCPISEPRVGPRARDAARRPGRARSTARPARRAVAGRGPQPRQADPDDGVGLDLLGALSLAADLALWLPAGHGVRATFVGSRIVR